MANLKEEEQININPRAGNLVEDVRDLSRLIKKDYKISGENSWVVLEKYIKEKDVTIKNAISYAPEMGSGERYVISIVIIYGENHEEDFGKELREEVIKINDDLVIETEQEIERLPRKGLEKAIRKIMKKLRLEEYI